MTIIYIYWNVSIIDKVYRKNHFRILEKHFKYFIYDYYEAKMQLLEEHDQLIEVYVALKHYRVGTS